jgi:hypothetical protein
MKLDKVKPINIDEFLARDRLRNRIYQVGVELEGGWTKLAPEVRLVHDGSVRVSAFPAEKEAELNRLGGFVRSYTATAEQQERFQKLYTEQQAVLTKLRVGELPSPILSVKSSDPMFWKEWVRKFYPSHVNETCGLHVHMSFQRALTYQRCMDPTYSKTILEYVSRWARKRDLPADHPIWPRLEGKCEYCQHTFHAEAQAKEAVKRNTAADHHRPGNRYSVVNYCWEQHHTFEVRLLPMFDSSERATDAIQEILNITNAYLLATRKKEDKIVSSVIIEPGEARTEFIELL